MEGSSRRPGSVRNGRAGEGQPGTVRVLAGPDVAQLGAILTRSFAEPVAVSSTSE